MDTSLLFEQLEWAFDQDALNAEGGYTEKIHAILKEALENAFDQGIDAGQPKGYGTQGSKDCY